jgi:hypothetical protein
MSEYPQPDLRDNGGRLRRLVFALLIGVAVGTLGYFMAAAMARPDSMVASHTARSVGRAYGFVFYVAAFAGAAAFSIALVLQNKLADKKYREGLVAQARVQKR